MSTGLCAVVVDMQDNYLKSINPDVRNNMINAQVEVLGFFKQNNLPAIFLEYDVYGLTISPLEKAHGPCPELPWHKFERIRKPSWTGFSHPDFKTTLEKWNISELVIMGVNASKCVRETAGDAIDNGYKIHTAADLIADSKDLDCLPSAPVWYTLNGTYDKSHRELLTRLTGYLQPAI